MNYYLLLGDFTCLKSAVQNGADAVYLGVDNFNARFFANNFNVYNVKEAIDYAHIRNVKVYLTLNTLIKDDEFNNVLNIVNILYSYGIDAIIVQDLGLATFLIKAFPDLPIHASTQMTINNLEGVLELEKIGFKRVVLSRELSISEIEYICKNSNIEIEVFIHGALCISYSGQCLFSSAIGGRSGNRGKCAQACRLPYKLIEKDNIIDNGYLLSPKDLCGLNYLRSLINAGVTSIKIEGRMKSPDYVGIVTKIYRKYVNKILNNESFSIDDNDKQELLLAFNRGGFSAGHLDNLPNNSLIYKEKSNNTGIYLGNVYAYNKNKGYVSLKLNANISLGDGISFEKENEAKYTISELMQEGKNIKAADIGQKVKVGRMKGNINIGDKVYLISSNNLVNSIKETYTSLEQVKRDLYCEIKVHENSPIILTIKDKFNNVITLTSNIIPVKAVNSPITKDRIINQISKTKNTSFQFSNIIVDLEPNLYIPKISELNALRRNALLEFENLLISKYTRRKKDLINQFDCKYTSNDNVIPKIALLLNILNLNYNYNYLEEVDKLYIPLKYFFNNAYKDIIKQFSNSNKNIYIYMPTIIKENYKKLFKNNIKSILENTNIKGFVISNLGTLELLKDYKDNYEFIANYTLNIFNSITAENLSLSSITVSPELCKEDLINLCKKISCKKELIVYGKLPLMTMGYCLLGKTNKCFNNCNKKCNNGCNYYLKDRLGLNFRIIPDNIETITTLYNSKITSIMYNDFNVDYVRIDVIDENIDEINNIIRKVKNNERFQGNNYTNGNLNKQI